MFTQLRLYAAFAGVLVAAALVAGLFWYRGQAIKAEAELETKRAELATAVSVNQSQKDAIDKIATFRARDDQLLVELNGKLDAIAKDNQDTQDALEALKTSDPEANTSLSTIVPDSVIRLLK